MRDRVREEARRRVREGASIIRSAIRLGADPEDVARAVGAAVESGAEDYAADVVEAYERARR